MTVLTPQVKIVTRGGTVHVAATFYDSYSQPAEPPDVRITFNYATSAGPVSASYAMAFNLFTGTFDYDWDSSVVVTPCAIYWSIVTGDSEVPVYAGQGTFTLQANPANLGAT